jgi:hypothetical protein
MTLNVNLEDWLNSVDMTSLARRLNISTMAVIKSVARGPIWQKGAGWS